jgi:hypothetical protein
MPYYKAKITLDKNGNPRVNKKEIPIFKTLGKRRFNQIWWEIKGKEDDVFAIYIEGNVFAEKRGKHNSYSVTIKKSGKGNIKTKVVRSQVPEIKYKYIIVRVSGARKTDVRVEDPRISVQG